MRGGGNCMIIKVPSKPTHSVMSSPLPKAGSVLRAAVPPFFCSPASTGLSSIRSGISPGQHLEQRGFVQAGGGAWHRHTGRKPSPGCHRESKHCTWIPLTLQFQTSPWICSLLSTLQQSVAINAWPEFPVLQFYIYIVLSGC